MGNTLDECQSKGTYWIALYVKNKRFILLWQFWVENIPKEVKKFIGNKNIITSIYSRHAYHSIMDRYFCIVFSDFMLKGKCLLDYTNLFFLDDYEKNDKIILKYFQ